MNKFNKITRRLIKPSYKYLSKDEKALFKLIEKKRQFEKELNGYNGFYARVERLPGGAVNWDALSEEELNLFDYLFSSLEKINKKISYREEKYNLSSDEIIEKYNMTQRSLSVSY